MFNQTTMLACLSRATLSAVSGALPEERTFVQTGLDAARPGPSGLLKGEDMDSVLQDWLQELPWKMQTVVITGIRGCDGLSKNDPSKQLGRAIRMAALNNADATTTYMRHDFSVVFAATKTFVDDLDRYPVHFVMHVAHACEILGYKHPKADFRAAFNSIYMQIVWALHLRPEPSESLDNRLADRRETVGNFEPQERGSNAAGTDTNLG